MKLPAISQLEAILSNNSPAILTAVGVTGTVTTAVLAGKASVKAVDHIRQEEEFRFDNSEELTTKEKVALIWRHFVPAAVSGALTVAAIVGANRIGARRAAGIAAAFKLAESAHAEYKEKVVETFGSTKEQKVRDDIAQDRVNRTPGSREVIVVGTEVKCYDAYTGRYFVSNMEALRKAQNDFNQEVINNSYESLTELYSLMGLSRTSNSDEVGFTTDKLLSFSFSTVLAEDGTPCISVDYEPTTIRGHWG